MPADVLVLTMTYSMHCSPDPSFEKNALLTHSKYEGEHALYDATVHHLP